MTPILVGLGFFALVAFVWRFARRRHQAIDNSSTGIAPGTPAADRADWLPSDFSHDSPAHPHDSSDSSGADAGASGGDSGGGGGGD